MRKILGIAAGVAIGILIVIALFVGVGSSKGGWQFKETRDPMTDKLSAENLLEGENGRLSISCAPGEARMLLIQANERLGGYGDDNFADRVFSYRLDASPPVKATGLIGDNFIGMPKDNPSAEQALIENLGAAQRLAVEVDTAPNGRVLMAFELKGVGDALQKLETSCPASRR